MGPHSRPPSSMPRKMQLLSALLPAVVSPSGASAAGSTRLMPRISTASAAFAMPQQPRAMKVKRPTPTCMQSSGWVVGGSSNTARRRRRQTGALLQRLMLHHWQHTMSRAVSRSTAPASSSCCCSSSIVCWLPERLGRELVAGSTAVRQWRSLSAGVGLCRSVGWAAVAPRLQRPTRATASQAPSSGPRLSSSNSHTMQQLLGSSSGSLLQMACAVRAYAKAAASGAAPGKRLGLSEVQHVVAVASGKGGVGKSTVAGARACARVC